MSDERWLTKDERYGRHNDGSQTMAEFLLDLNGDLLDHAEAADELIADLAEALRTHVAFSTTAGGTCAWPEHSAGGNAYYTSTDVLARVDALTKDTT